MGLVRRLGFQYFNCIGGIEIKEDCVKLAYMFQYFNCIGGMKVKDNEYKNHKNVSILQLYRWNKNYWYDDNKKSRFNTSTVSVE